MPKPTTIEYEIPVLKLILRIQPFRDE